MDNEQLEKNYKELVDRYGQDLPNPAHEPRKFLYYVRLMRWHKELLKRTVDSNNQE